MKKEKNIKKIKTTIKLIIITILILSMIKIFNPDSPRKFYYKHKTSLNKIIKNVNKSKESHSKKSFIFGIKDIYYSSNDVYESDLVEINLRNKPFSSIYYTGLIYSYTGKACIPELPDGYLQEVGNGIWYYSDGIDDYFRVEHIEGNWFTYEWGSYRFGEN